MLMSQNVNGKVSKERSVAWHLVKPGSHWCVAQENDKMQRGEISTSISRGKKTFSFFLRLRIYLFHQCYAYFTTSVK